MRLALYRLVARITSAIIAVLQHLVVIVARMGAMTLILIHRDAFVHTKAVLEQQGPLSELNVLRAAEKLQRDVQKTGGWEAHDGGKLDEVVTALQGCGWNREALDEFVETYTGGVFSYIGDQ